MKIRPIVPDDNPAIEALIKKVMPEFGASGPGFAIQDPEVRDMHSAYNRDGSAFFVVMDGDRIVGGSGIAPLNGADTSICEIRKMYFLPEARGLGVGRRLLDRVIQTAREFGYSKCYLETLKGMVRARQLYEANGFKQIYGPLGNTGHFGCDTWYIKEFT